jgi:hypothetical protein
VWLLVGCGGAVLHFTTRVVKAMMVYDIWPYVRQQSWQCSNAIEGLTAYHTLRMPLLDMTAI